MTEVSRDQNHDDNPPPEYRRPPRVGVIPEQNDDEVRAIAATHSTGEEQAIVNHGHEENAIVEPVHSIAPVHPINTAATTEEHHTATTTVCE